MKIKVLVTIEVREVRDVRRHRHLSTKHKDAISRGLCRLHENARRREQAAKPGRCAAGHPNCTCHYCLRAAAYNAKRTPKSQTPAEAFTLLQEYAIAMQPLIAKTGVKNVMVESDIIAIY